MGKHGASGNWARAGHVPGTEGKVVMGAGQGGARGLAPLVGHGRHCHAVRTLQRSPGDYFGNIRQCLCHVPFRALPCP
jgi:hypothetical protein